MVQGTELGPLSSGPGVCEPPEWSCREALWSTCLLSPAPLVTFGMVPLDQAWEHFFEEMGECLYCMRGEGSKGHHVCLWEVLVSTICVTENCGFLKI